MVELPKRFEQRANQRTGFEHAYGDLTRQDFLNAQDKLKKGIVLFNEDGLTLTLTTNYTNSNDVPMVEYHFHDDEEGDTFSLDGPDQFTPILRDFDLFKVNLGDFLGCYYALAEKTDKTDDLIHYCFIKQCSIESVINKVNEIKSEIKDFGKGLRLWVGTESDAWQDGWTEERTTLEPDALALLKFLQEHSRIPEGVITNDAKLKENQRLIAHAEEVFCKRWPDEATKLGMKANSI